MIRSTKTSISITGDPETSTGADKPHISNLQCTTQPDDNKLITPMTGQTAIDYRILYCDLYQSDGTPVDIKLKDTVKIISAPNDANVGTKYLVVQVNEYAVDEMQHMEVRLQGGVL